MPTAAVHIVSAGSARSVAADALPGGARLSYCTPDEFKDALLRKEVSAAIVESSAAAELHDWLLALKRERRQLPCIYLDPDPASAQSRHAREWAAAFVTVRSRHTRLWDAARMTVLRTALGVAIELFDRPRSDAPLFQAVAAALRRPVPFSSVNEWADETGYERSALYTSWQTVVGPSGPTPAEFIRALILMHALQVKVSHIGWGKRLASLGVTKHRLADISARCGLPDPDALAGGDVLQLTDFFEERIVGQVLAPIASMKRNRRGRPPARSRPDRQKERHTDGVVGKLTNKLGK